MKLTSDQMPFLSQYGSEKHLDHMAKTVPNFSQIATENIVRNPFAQKKHLENVKLTPYNWSDKYALIDHPNLPDSWREQFLRDGGSLNRSVLKRPDTTKEHLKTVLTQDSPSSEAVEHAVRHPLADAEILHLGLSHPLENVRRVTLREGSNINRSHVEHMLTAESPSERVDALSHGLATVDDHVNAAHNDPDYRVRRYAVIHHDFPTDELKKVHANDTHADVKSAVIDRLKLRGEQP